MSLLIDSASARIVLAKGQPVPNDPYLYTNTVLLLHGDGTNGSTTILDSSKVVGSPKTVTAFGDAQISTAIADPFGNSTRGVLLFNGATATRLAIASSASLAFGVGAYTIEAWIFPTSYAALQGSIFDFGNASGALDFFLTSSGALGIGVYAIGNIFVTSASAVPLNQWSFVSVIRSSAAANSTKIYVNGALAATGTDSNNWLVVTAPSSGGVNLTSYSFIGYIDDLRITKGVARYTSNFTPPTAPFPDF